MSEAKKSILDDSTLSVTLSVGQLRALIREEIEKAIGQNGNNMDKLLDADAAAELLSVSKDWLYTHARKLPFTRKLAPKVLRFSRQGIEKYLTTRKMP